MSTNPYDTYLEATVLSADPIELIRILYRTAIESVHNARMYLASGEVAARSRAISKGVAVLVELGFCLKSDADPRLARNLTELYDFMQRRLLTANLDQSDAPLAEVAGLLENLSDAWERIDLAPPCPAFTGAYEYTEMVAADY
jgi:flagellar protein FliS